MPAAIEPEVVIVAPCGYDVERGHEEALRYRDRLDALGADRVAIAGRSCAMNT